MLRKVAIGVLAVTLIVSTLACGSGKGKRRGSSRSGSDSGNSSTQNNGANAGSAQEVNVDKTVWYAGMKLTFGKLAYRPDDPAASRLTMETTVENVADTGVTGSPAFSLKIGDKAVSGGFDRDLREVPAGETSKTTVEFSTTGSPGDLGKGVLTVGDGQSAQAVVPLAGGGQTITLEPVKLLAAPVTVSSTDMTYTFKSCDLRADKPDDHRQIGKDQRVILCTLDAQSKAAGARNLLARNFRLRLPDNTVVAPDHGPNEVLDPQERVLDQQVRFLIKWPAAGQYKVQGLTSNGGTTGAAEVPLTISAA
jgi:hypothetical protein